MDKLNELADICLRNNENRFNEYWRQIYFVKQLGLNPKQFDINTSVKINRGDIYNRIDSTTTCLVIVSEYAKASFVEELLRRGARKDIADINGNTPLHVACQTTIDPVRKVIALQGNDYNLMNKPNNSGKRHTWHPYMKTLQFYHS